MDVKQLKKWLNKKISFNREVKDFEKMNFFHRCMHNEALWCWNCQTVARAVAIGLFLTPFTLLPMQMLIALFLAIIIRANIPLAIGMTWISNPFTIVPLTYLNYQVGNVILQRRNNVNVEAIQLQFHNFTAFLTSFSAWIMQSGKAYFIGAVILAMSFAIIGYCIVILLWKQKIFLNKLWQPVFKSSKKAARILQLSVQRFIDEKLSYRASALAFSSLLSIVPLLLVIFFFITIFPFISTISLVGKTYILQNFVPSSADKIEYYFHGFLNQAYHLPVFNIIFLVISVTMLVYTIEEALNDIWEVPNRHRFDINFLIYSLFFLLLPFIIGLGVFVTSYFLSLAWISSATNWLGVTNLFISLLPLFINMMIFGCIYKYIPNAKVKWRNALYGGAIAALLFETARIVFVYYITRYPTYSLIYGAFAIFPIFLIWLYIFWFIILFSGLIAYTAGKHEEPIIP